ncbi:MAG: 3-dehydroquinate synthase [Pseudomonadota bacterium]
MKTLDVHGATGHSRLLVGERLSNLPHYLPPGRTIIITDTIVRKLYGNAFPDVDVIAMGTGERAKTLASLEDIYGELIAREADRSVFIVGIGGGIVCDVTGFVASTYLRGVRFGFVSTTLLAQVDASVGGKNGVNFGGYKNMVGVFNQPEFVICDLEMLCTLPKSERHSGFAEIIKHAAIGNAALFDFMERSAPAAKGLDEAVIERFVVDSVALKAGIVSRDEKETGERRKLNFGHTLGHAIEKTTGVSHGEAVAAGMVFAAGLSVSRGLLDTAAARRLTALIEAYGLPIAIPAEGRQLMDALRRDKKRAGEGIHFVLLDGLGSAVVQEIPIAELEQALVGKK